MAPGSLLLSYTETEETRGQCLAREDKASNEIRFVCELYDLVPRNTHHILVGVGISPVGLNERSP